MKPNVNEMWFLDEIDEANILQNTHTISEYYDDK